MDKNEKKFYKMMHDQPEGVAEKLSESLPPLTDEDKKRITESAIRKAGEESSESFGSPEEIVVTGTEVYQRPKWYRYAASAAAIAAVFLGISSIVHMNRNMTDDNSGQSSQSTTGFTVNTFTATETTSATTVPATSTTAVTTSTSAVTTVPVYYSEPAATSLHTTSAVQTTEVSTSSAETTETTAASSTTVTDTETTTAVSSESEQVTTTAAAAMPFKTGVWLGESSEGRREVTFNINSDGIGGSIIPIDDNPNGIGAPFQCEFDGNTITFHMFAIENNTKAEFTVEDENTVILNWDYGTTETLTYLPAVAEE